MLRAIWGACQRSLRSSNCGGPAQQGAMRWRSDGPSGPSKRVQDKVVQDPKQIKATEVRIVFPDGGHEIKSPTEAFKDAARAGQALLSVAPNASPPVFRIGEPEELIAGQAKKERDARRRQLDQRRSSIMKEMRFRPDTADHDLQMKMVRVEEFLGKGHKLFACETVKALTLLWLSE
ncbi:hypothetical protein WJX84_005888 [Apatococcus fuscideae]|uniref:Translation initiation factor 3 N-terminal domain-containing protein n=1 Tax=Apatococcus fuscideae TaxID=2026836 RepID=A0AAW1TBP6_9CHLO